MKLPEHVDKLRDLIEAAFDKHFARLGIGKAKLLEADKLPAEVREKKRTIRTYPRKPHRGNRRLRTRPGKTH